MRTDVQPARLRVERTTPALEAVDVSKRWGDFVALNGVSLRLESREVLALLGPNGAGKSTLIAIACGLVRATRGTVRVAGHDVVEEARAARANIGLAPQEMNYDPAFTPRETLRHHLGMYGFAPDEDRIEEVLGIVALEDKADADTRSLSGGMRRRLMIAKAIVHRPRVLFLDEPTAGVDVALRRRIMRRIGELRSDGAAIVLTTHHLEEAEALADRVAVLDRGRVIALDTPKALLMRFGAPSLEDAYLAATGAR